MTAASTNAQVVKVCIVLPVHPLVYTVHSVRAGVIASDDADLTTPAPVPKKMYADTHPHLTFIYHS